MYNKSILSIQPLGFNWPTNDPFLFCVHHADAYPKGNARLGPEASLTGRNLGQDFTLKDGWRMYHGETVPGFPAHPHRGFETVTIVLEGYVDHSDSHGAAGRYGQGDVQWMTAGSGLQHAEMFPLLNQQSPNPLELFQVWLNLPKANKFARPHYKMLWAEDIPRIRLTDSQANTIEITLIAGRLREMQALAPAPDSWAADPENEVAIWIIELAPSAAWDLPPAEQIVNRTLYFFAGTSLQVAGSQVPAYHAVHLIADQPVTLKNGADPAHLLLLQGRPIAEPVAQYGPFVMNTYEEIQQAFAEYRRTQFGGWPWQRADPVHPVERGRFARYADGVEEIKNP
jgi:hypothetical protein